MFFVLTATVFNTGKLFSKHSKLIITTLKSYSQDNLKIRFSVKTSFLQTPSSSPMLAMRNLFCVSTAALLARPDWVLRSIIGIYQALVQVPNFLSWGSFIKSQWSLICHELSHIDLKSDTLSQFQFPIQLPQNSIFTYGLWLAVQSWQWAWPYWQQF